MNKRDYYEVLGVGRDADEQTLKSAYRKMALKYHPDRNPGDKEAEERFKEAAEAYSVLSDPQKRAAYDRYGHAGISSSAGAPSFDPSIFADFTDIFGDFFGFADLFGTGTSHRGTRAQRGEDVRYDLEINFEDAMKGLHAEILVPKTEICPRCKGQRGEPGKGLVTCPLCRGQGELFRQHGFLSIRSTCSQCGGTGRLIRHPCTQCRGEGYVHSEKRLKVNVPPGVDTGTRLRLTGEGNPGHNGGPPGDLYVAIKVREHPIFERIENDLHCTVPINIAQAALGTEITVPTIDGPEALKIPEGTQHGTRFRLRGRGVPFLNGHGRGDLYVHVEVTVPAKLTREQRKLLEQLAQTLPAQNEPHERRLFDKVKDYFM